VSVIIPTWKAARYLCVLLPALARQEPPPFEVIVIDSSSPDGSAAIAQGAGCVVTSVAQAEFNHGGTRNRAAALARGDILVFMTQDALPADAGFLAALVAPLVVPGAEGGTCAGAYARQIPYDDADPVERFARAWNYPAQGERRTAADIPRLGIRANFFSNVAAAVRRDAFAAAGGFPADTILNEDMVLCARLLARGEAVAYVPAAVVRHSHAYTLGQQFARYFDIGVFFQRNRGEVASGGSGAAGMRFVRALLARLVADGQAGWIPRALADAAVRFLGFHLGKRERFLPLDLKRSLSMHAGYWRAAAAPAPGAAR
jgi:rhamnosyltransferase